MSLFSQPLDGFKAAFTFPKLLDRRSLALFVIYYLVAIAAIAGFAGLLFYLKPSIKQAILDYFFPTDWQFATQAVVESVFGRLGSLLLSNFILVGGMGALAILCSPLKELLSRRIEKAKGIADEPFLPWPLWRQALEEVKFAAFYLLAYNVIFWIGYPPNETNRTLARVLSYVALFIFFNITFLCPLFLRHRIGYGRMIRVFLLRPLPSFSFAALGCAPALVVAALVQDAPIGVAIALLLSAHVLVVAPAATGGTWLAGRLLPVARKMQKTPVGLRLVGWLALLAVLGGSGFVTYRLAESFHKKSQILKCSYLIDRDSAKILWPTAEADLGLSFALVVKNPTEVDMELERSRFEITNNKKPFATVWVDPIRVPAGETVRQVVTLHGTLSLARLLTPKELFSADWDYALWIKIDDTWEFPIYFR